MKQTALITFFLLGSLCVFRNARAQFTFSPDTLDFGTIIRGQDKYLIDTVTNTSGNYLYIGSLRDLHPSKRIQVTKPVVQPIGIPAGRSYVFSIEYFADTASTEVDTVVVSQYKNGDGQKLIVRGNAIDTASNSVAPNVKLKPTLHVDSEPVIGDLKVTITMPHTEHVSFTIRDLLGRVVLTNEEYLVAGTHEHLFTTSSLTSGDYILEMRSAQLRVTAKFAMIH
jgi:hypothetical protein